MENSIRLDSVEAAIEDIRNGKVVIIVDDENRENEGDFVGAAEMVTPEMINFMAKEGRGLICVPLSEKRCKEIKLDWIESYESILSSEIEIVKNMISKYKDCNKL